MDREQYFEHLIPLALRLVGAVHDEGPEAITGALNAIHAIPTPHDTDPSTSIAVILAAMVNPKRTPKQLLGWTNKFLPDLIPDHQAADDTPLARPLFVEMCVSGVLPAHALTATEMHQAVKILLDRGHGTTQILDHLPDADPATIRRLIATIRTRNRHAAA